MVGQNTLRKNVDEWRRKHGLKPLFEKPQEEFTIHLVVPTSIVEAVQAREKRKAAAQKAAQTRKAKRAVSK